ncbi:MAG: multiheme c-type cytochrome [Planctomycetaceae bacterium]
MFVEWILYGLLGLAGLLIVGLLPVRLGLISLSTMAAAIAAIALVAVGVTLQRNLWENRRLTAEVAIPEIRTDGLYAGSAACRSCHAEQYDTWHGSFHRTMTQVATPETVVAPFDGQELTRYGQTARIERRGDEFWATMQDPQLTLQFATVGAALPEGGFPLVERQLVMTTGSHAFQAFWYVGNDAGELWQFPWRYNITDRLWMHRDDVFLQPPVTRPAMGHQVWNQVCINCHSVGGQPGFEGLSGRYRHTRTAELGISCESCHGACGQHVAQNRNPVRRYQFHLNETESDRTVFNPAKENPHLSSQACGTCHSHYEYDHGNPANRDHQTLGREHDPRRDMRDVARFLTIDDETVFDDGKEQIQVSRFWSDGACRSGGREYNGLIESGCYLRGNLTCLSCHAVHGSDPDDQLKPGMRTNHACLQCHTDFADDVSRHTHHPAESSGSECMNCHMPYSSFALLKGIRSHRIDSPAVASFGPNVRLNACNLCHLDRTQQWTADVLSEWYQSEAPELSDDEKSVSAAVLWMLKGDAGQRVISTWQFAQPDAAAVSSTDWMTPFLAAMLNDPYAAVRLNAAKALASLFPEQRDVLVPLSVSESVDDRRRAAERLRSRWQPVAPSPTSDRDGSLLIHDGVFDDSRLNDLLQHRDDRPIVIVE